MNRNRSLDRSVARPLSCTVFAGLLFVYVLALSPHLVHHIHVDDHGERDHQPLGAATECLFASSADRLQGAVPEAPVATATETVQAIARGDACQAQPYRPLTPSESRGPPLLAS